VIETVWLEVPNVAVMTAVWLDGIVPAVMVKVAEEDPGATAAVAGTVRRLSLLDSETVVPSPDTVRFRVTVQVVVPAEFNDVETHVTEATVLVASTGKVTALLT
jgi:hypothetical protein